MIELKGRLKTIAEKVDKGETMADIGTDHGFLPFYLIENGISPKVVLCDISPGSLAKAKQNAEYLSSDEGVDFRLGDGIDVLSVVFAKKIGISIGTFVMLFNTALYTICGIALQSWILPLYSIVTYYVGSKVVDFITEGFDRAKCAMIVTVKANEISDALSEHFGSSGTIVKAIGGYSKEEKEIIYFIVNRFQINKLKIIVHNVDEYAFISLQEVADIIKKRDV